MKRKWVCFIILLFIAMFFYFNVNTVAADYNIYFNGEEIDKEDVILVDNGYVYLQARFLSDLIDADLKWQESIKSVELSKDDDIVKMMVGNLYLQINDTTLKTDKGLLVDEGSAFLPGKYVMDAFDYVVTEEEDDNNLYIYKPETLIKGIGWEEEGSAISIEASSLSSYEIKDTEKSNQLVIEIDRAELSSGFLDGISSDDYDLQIERSSKKEDLRFIINSEKHLPFSEEAEIDEKDNRIVINLMPNLEKIAWEDEQLNIKTDGIVKEPEITYIDDPRRIIVDIPSLMAEDFTDNLKENEYIENIEVKPHKENPHDLRIIGDLKGDYYFNITGSEKGNIISLKPGDKSNLSNLSYNEEKRAISFESNMSLKPEIFELNDPYRLVINLNNARRGSNFKDKIEYNDDILNSIRTSRFDRETIRIVADLNKEVNYQWLEEESEDGYHHTISFQKGIRDIMLSEDDDYNNIKIDLSGKVDYEVRKFSDPHRIVVDIRDLDIDKQELDLPSAEGIIEEINTGIFEEGEEKRFRIVFELDEFYGYDINSKSRDDSIEIALPLFEKDDEKFGDLIIIDAGHGGFDPGAIGPSGVREKDITLNLAREVDSRLSDSGYNVKLTRDRDEFISLPERVKIAEDENAGLFVSIHANAARNSYSNGTETYISLNGPELDMNLAQRIHSSLMEEIKLEDRGIRKDNFYVIKNTTMPSVLTEVAFLSNSHEESLLDSELFRRRVARSIADGIVEFMEKNNMEASN
ncbi:MAG: N-acetylmuramoyl-L-alanine amidase [bacterium]